MGFVNCALEESERRSYETSRMDKTMAFGGGTIDRENDVRLFCYANGPVREPSDIYSFVFDYKGEVFDIDFYQTWVNHDTVDWRVMTTNKDLSKEQLESLRKAMKVFAGIGYKKDPLIMDHFNKVNVEVRLWGEM